MMRHIKPPLLAALLLLGALPCTALAQESAPEGDEAEKAPEDDDKGDEGSDGDDEEEDDEIIVLDDPEEDDEIIVLDEEEEDDEVIALDEEADEDEEKDPELGPIIVTATPEELARLGGSADNIGEKELEEFEYDDIHNILTGGTTGVYVRQEDAFGLRPNIGMRGANSDRSKKVTLMEDGILLGPAPYSAPAAYFFPLMTRMTGVEVYKGPAAVRFGPNTIGGAINFVSREIPFDLEGTADLAFGTFATGLAPSGKLHLHYGGSSTWGGFLVEGVHLQSDGFKELDTGGDTGFSKSEVSVTGQINSDLSAEVFHRLRLKVGFARESSHETYLGLSDADFADNPYRRYSASDQALMEWIRAQLQLQYRMDIGEHTNITMTLYRHDFDRSWRKLNRFLDGPSIEEILADPTSGQRQVFFAVLTGQEDSASAGETLQIGTNHRIYVSEGFQGEASLTRGDEKTWATHLRLGLRLHHDQVERDHTEEGFLMESGALIDSGDPELTVKRNRGQAVAFATWLTNVSTWKALSVAPGIRLEVIQTELLNRQTDSRTTNLQEVFLPGIGFHYAFTSEFGALAGVHRGFSPVSPGQPDGVEPETSLNYEAGVRYANDKSKTNAEIVGFFNDYTNLTGECSFSAGCNEALLDQQFNAGEVEVFGLETMVSHRFKLGKSGLAMPAKISYTLTRSSFQTDFISDNPQFGEVEVGDELPYVPIHQGAAKLGLEGEGFGLNLSASFVDEMREIAGQGEPEAGEKTESYVMVDAAAHLDVWGSAKVYLKVDNMLNAQPIVARRPFGARPAKPFLAQIGFKVDF